MYVKERFCRPTDIFRNYFLLVMHESSLVIDPVELTVSSVKNYLHTFL